MLVLEWKERAFIEKVNSRCFCWFPAAILVDSFCPPIWRFHTKLYKGAWNVSADNSETAGQKDLRFGQNVYILVFYNISFSWLLPLSSFQYFFWCSVYCVTVKTIYSRQQKYEFLLAEASECAQQLNLIASLREPQWNPALWTPVYNGRSLTSSRIYPSWGTTRRFSFLVAGCLRYCGRFTPFPTVQSNYFSRFRDPIKNTKKYNKCHFLQRFRWACKRRGRVFRALPDGCYEARV